MDFKEILKASMSEYLTDVENTLDSLSSEERKYQPTPDSHHINFAVWHMARVEDTLVNKVIKKQEEIWVSNNWQGKLGINGDGNGYGYTQEQLENFPEIDINTLLEYYQAVRTNIFEYIDGLTQADLDRDLGMNRKAPFDTVGNLLSHLVIEEAEHAGQVRYLRGMQRGLNK